MCQCSAGRQRFEDTQWCIPAELKIVLSGATVTRPLATGGSPDVRLVAKVTENGLPKAGVDVHFSVEVREGTGGHDHQGGGRPTGSIQAVSINSDANGEVKALFKPSAFAGIHKIQATCGGCGTRFSDLEVTVKVPDLVELPANPSKYTIIGTTTKHISNHYLTEASVEALNELLKIMKAEGWTNPGINDASLVWGGLFDIGGSWTPSHHEHREGNEVDISFYRPAGVSDALRQKVFDKLKNGYSFGLPQVLWHLKDNPSTKSFAHFHVYLLAQKASFTKPY